MKFMFALLVLGFSVSAKAEVAAPCEGKNHQYNDKLMSGPPVKGLSQDTKKVSQGLKR
jgi:hypothetical protein